MRTLIWQDVEDILVGAAIMGCGGGGELAEGRSILRTIYEAGHAVTLASPDEIDADVLVACPYGVGGLTVPEESAYGDRPLVGEHPAVLAVRALGTYLSRTPGALITGEIGATSIADAFVPAAVMGLPVVDADAIGRAVPELQNSLFSVHDVSITPQAVVNAVGDTVLITAVADDARAETLVRSLAVASNNCVWVVDHVGAWRSIRDVVIQGAISQALHIGSAWRTAAENDDDVAAAVVTAGEGIVLFRGRVSACEWQERDGFTWGEIHLQGRRDNQGANYRIWFKNENLIAWRDSEVDITAPDLIAVLALDGTPVSNPRATPGDEVTVVGLPAADAWHDTRALEFFGPRHFGFDVDDVPLTSKR